MGSDLLDIKKSKLQEGINLLIFLNKKYIE